jgi:peptidoglycan hydrolase CwlO-like protein
MTAGTNFQDSPPNSQASSGESINDSRTERELWRDFYYRDGKHESDINHINRQLTVIQTEISGIKSDIKTEIASVKTEIKTEIDGIKTDIKNLDVNLNAKIVDLSAKVEKMLAEYDKNVSLMLNERTWNKTISIAALSAFIFTIVLSTFFK